MNKPKSQRFKTASGREVIDMGAVFDNEAADGGGPVTLTADDMEIAADGTLSWKIGAPLVVGIIADGKLK
jgi:hypothetical protein